MPMPLWGKVLQSKNRCAHLTLVQGRVLVMQVYVSVYADGPTRVLRFADAKSTALLEAEQSILDLAARLKQVSVSTPHNHRTCIINIVSRCRL